MREIDRNHVELTVVLVYAPMLAAGAAVLAGIGTNLISDAGDNATTTYLGLGFVFAGLLAIAGGGARLLRTVRTPRPWLTRARFELGQHAEMKIAPDDLLRIRRRVQRNRQVGERLIERANGLTMRRWWLRRPW